MANVAKRRRAAFLAWMEANDLNASMVAKRSGVPYTTINSYEKNTPTGTQSLRGDNESRIAEAYDLPIEAIFGFGDPPDGEKQENNLRAWREYRRLKASEVAAGVGTTTAIYELLEAGGATLSLKWLYKIAPVFGVNAGTVADFKPSELPAHYLEGLPEIQRPPSRPAVLTDTPAKSSKTGTHG